MIDPRGAVVARRLAGVRRVIAVCSAKGGVGKTVCACAAAASFAAEGRRAGLLDLDLQGATAHVVLGVSPGFPAEDRGILPLPAGPGLGYMGAAAFTGERALPLRGAAVTDAMLEMLSVTRWGALEALFIDMPPGLGEELLDLSRLVPRAEALVVSTPARLSVAVVERLLALLRETGMPVRGVAATMARGDADPVRTLAARAGAAFAGEVPWVEGLEAAFGDPAALAAGRVGRAVRAALAAAGIG